MLLDINGKEIKVGQKVVVSHNSTTLLKLNVLNVMEKTTKLGGMFKGSEYEGLWKPTAIMVIS